MWSHSIHGLVKHKTSLIFFLINFEQLISDIVTKNPLFVLITDDFNGINGNAFQLIKSFLHKKCQRVILNGQSSRSLSIRAGVPQGSVLGSLFFLIYINDIPKGLNPEVKFFADYTFLFSIVNCINTSASKPNSDLLKMQDWAYQWKMSFNPD